MLGTSPEEMGVEPVTVLELEDVGHDGVVEEVLSDVGRLHDGFDTVLR